MPHPRKLIRHAIKAQLVNQTLAGARVFTTRFVSMKASIVPYVCIYTLQEAVDPESVKTAPRELKRLMDMIIELTIKATDQIVSDNGGNIDDALDDFADQVERRISVDDTLKGLASDVVYMGVDQINIREEGDQLYITAPLLFRGTYYRDAPLAEDLPLDDFSTADVRYNLGGQMDEANEAHDVLTGLENA